MKAYLGTCGLRKNAKTSASTASVRDVDVNPPHHSTTLFDKYVVDGKRGVYTKIFSRLTDSEHQPLAY